MNSKVINIFIILISTSILFGCNFDFGEPIGTSKTIEFIELNERIKIETKAWGLAGNHETVTISNQKNSITFNASEAYYKKTGSDSLIIYISSNDFEEKLKKWTSPVKLVLYELKTYDDVQDYCLNHKKYGLSKISIYSPDRNCIPEELPKINN